MRNCDGLLCFLSVPCRSIRRGRRVICPRQKEHGMNTFEMATSLLVGIAAQTLVIGLILVG
jgi:hypothetical protein